MTNWSPSDADMRQVEPALLRAAQAAQDMARRHQIPLVIWRDGRIVHVPPQELPLTPESTP